MFATHCKLKVFINLQLAYATIQFWLLFTQLVVSVAASSHSDKNNSVVSTLPQHFAHPHFDVRQQVPLMDKTLTHCDSGDNINWRPVCATSNGVDFVLFGSECLMWQTNRERHTLETGQAAPVFREIALGFCRPNCSVVICEGSKLPICARNLQTDEVRRFSESCEMARDVCLNDNDWQQIADSACGMPSGVSRSASTVSASTKLTSPSSEIKNVPLNTPQIATLGVHFTGLPKNQINNHQRKAIPCPKVFNPICAELHGVKATFINECLVNAENVKFGQSWQIASKGVCGEDYTSSTTHKNAVNKRSTVDSATFVYQLNAPEKELIMNISWTPNIRYVAQDGLRSYGEEMHLNQSPMWPKSHSIRILPEIDDSVAVCKFGDGPVCGSSARYTYTVHSFGNICELLLRNIILSESWSVVNEGKCKRCVLNCPTDYEPICISRNGLSYTIINQCHLDYAICRNKQSTWKILGKGECSNVLKYLKRNKYDHFTGYTNCNDTVKRLFKTTPYLNTQEETPPRHARKALEPSTDQETNEHSLSNSLQQSSSKPPVEFVIIRKSSSPAFGKKAVKYSRKKSLASKTTANPVESQSHVMNLWRSSKSRRSPVADDK